MIRKTLLALGLAMLASSFASAQPAPPPRHVGPHVRPHMHRPPPPPPRAHKQRRGHWEMRHGRRVWVTHRRY